MSLTKRSTMTLNGVQFNVDPDSVERDWPRRHSVSPVLGGDVLIQDWGRYAKDMTITITSGTQYMDRATVKAIDALVAVRGATYTLVDWEGNAFTVFVTDWKPKPTFIGDLYTFTLDLQVTAITTLWAAAYTGS